MTSDIDPRLTPWRRELAAAHLRGRVEADAYAEGSDSFVVAGAAPIRAEPRGDAPLTSQALFGEAFTVYEKRRGWAWGQLASDGYVGYVPEELVVSGAREPTHRVAAIRTLLFAEAAIKAPVLEALSLNSPVRVVGREGAFARLDGGGFVPALHLAAIGEWAGDFVTVAESLVGAPYLWGGRTSLGLDCSALVQLALGAAGIEAPRDSDMQAAGLGTMLEPDREARRGDLVFWAGHVAIMVNATRIVHANAHHMATVVEPLVEAAARIAPLSGPVASVRRPVPA